MLRKLSLFVLLAFIGTQLLKAETPDDKNWTKAGYLGLKMTQAGFTNWATGGDNAVALDMQANYQADYKNGKHLWQNRLELGYGMNKTGGQGLRKTSDKIYLNSNYGYELYKNLYLSGLVNFRTQFAPGYDYSPDPDVLLSRFMAPGYLMTGIGLTWTPVKYFTAVLSPATWRGTFVMSKELSDQGAFGVKAGKNLLSEFGANLKLEVQYEFLKNMTVYSRLDLFSDYLRKPQNVDVNWEVQINMAINKWFSATFTTNLIYDDDIKILHSDGSRSPAVQFKEVLGVGLQYNF